MVTVIKRAAPLACFFLLAEVHAATPLEKLSMVVKNEKYEAFLRECYSAFEEIVGKSTVLSHTTGDQNEYGEFKSSYYYKVEHEDGQVLGPFTFECRQKPGEAMTIAYRH